MKALREMAAAAGYVDASLIDEAAQLGEFAQTLRRDLVDALVNNRAKYNELRKKLHQITDG